MTTLSPIDLWIIGGYLFVTLALGLWLRRRATQNLEHYYLGGRLLPWPLLGLSGMTNWFDLTGTMVITSFLYLLGPRGLFIEFRGGAGARLHDPVDREMVPPVRLHDGAGVG